MTAFNEDLARRWIELGTTAADLGPRSAGAEEATSADNLELHKHWPAGLAPVAQALPGEPTPFDPLPEADYLVITWTVAELEALAAVLTPGVSRDAWYRYARGFEESYLSQIRPRAPARAARRLGSYYLTRIGTARVLCFKSELHLNQDGIMQPSGFATLPVKDLFKQLIREVKPKLVITVGTAGATYPEHHLGDVFVTRAATFHCRSEFARAPFNHKTYRSDFALQTAAFASARELLRFQDAHLVEPDFGPPTAHYPDASHLVLGFKNRPSIRIDGGGGPGDLPAFQPILTTDTFEFGTTGNKLEELGCGVEMGDAVLGLAVEELGTSQRWLVIRNASDPAINAALPHGPRPFDVQAHWAVWYYESFGFWTSVNSAIATWAVVVGDHGGH
jgi:hypothetical protein